MQVQVNTDHNIDAHPALTGWISGVVESAMGRMSDRITRVEVHLRDENSDKKSGAREMRCVMEARLEGRKPAAVTNQAATVNAAVEGAAEKLSRMLESTVGRLRGARGTPREKYNGPERRQAVAGSGERAGIDGYPPAIAPTTM